MNSNRDQIGTHNHLGPGFGKRSEASMLPSIAKKLNVKNTVTGAKYLMLIMLFFGNTLACTAGNTASDAKNTMNVFRH